MVKLLVRLLLIACTLSALPAMAAQDVLIEAEFDTQEVRVNAQAVYRLRVLHAVDVSDLRITGPSARLADFRVIHEDRVTETRRDGRQYRVHERSYAVFPFASGTLELSGARASGRIIASGAKSPDRRIPIALDAPVRKLTVLPVGVQAEGHAWLPARSLSLSEDWTTVDGAQRRTIRIEAAGVDAMQIPAVPMTVAGMTVRAEAPRLTNRLAGEQNVATLEQAFVLTPARAGRIDVPQFELPWWHTELDSPALATLPARTLEGLPEVSPAEVPAAAYPGMPGGIAAALGVLALAGALAWRRRNSMYAAWKLRRACLACDLRAVRDGLLEWAAGSWPDAAPLTLAALARQLKDPGAQRAAGAIERALYGAAMPSYDASTLKAMVLAIKRDGK